MITIFEKIILIGVVDEKVEKVVRKLSENILYIEDVTDFNYEFDSGAGSKSVMIISSGIEEPFRSHVEAYLKSISLENLFLVLYTSKFDVENAIGFIKFCIADVIFHDLSEEEIESMVTNIDRYENNSIEELEYLLNSKKHVVK